uniref:Uncharacterized protein n=1 Tax=virus sp. ctQmo6 TaxID=2827990 RepID=A0A8S5RGN6_9VIRU|nr:MAG TPA: hypothetical protein [virus sp. ctQmo6]
MIKSNMGEVEINGTTTIILAEFSALTKGMVESLTENYGKDEAKEMVERSYKRGLMSEKEIRKESVDILSDILETLKNHIEEE